MDAVRSLMPSRNSVNWAWGRGCAAPQLWQKDAYGSTPVPQFVQNGNAPVLHLLSSISTSSIQLALYQLTFPSTALFPVCSTGSLPRRSSIAFMTIAADSERLSKSVRHSMSGFNGGS